jgi:hypothetical protein
MTKRTIISGWIAGTVAQIPAAILIIASFVALLAHLEPVTAATRYNIVAEVYSRTMVGLMALGGLIAGASMIAQLVAWIGAVRNTRRLADRRWFNVLLWSGIVGIVTTLLFGLDGLISGTVMIPYLAAGPDAIASQPATLLDNLLWGGILTASLFGLGALISGSVMIAYLVAGPDAIASRQLTLLEKRSIKQWSIWGTVAMVVGSFFPLFVARATNEGGFLHGLLWPALALDTLGFAVAVCGVIAVTVAWWGAVFNTHRLADKTWFNLLLWSGSVGTVTSPLFGIGALVSGGVLLAYLVAGPDGIGAGTTPMTTPTATLAPTS